MKILAWFLFSAGAALAADIQAFLWRETREEKTREPQYTFFIAPKAVREMVEASARGDDDAAEQHGARLAADAWLYTMRLTGGSRIYRRERILMGSGHDIIEIAAGSVELDVAKREVKIALQIVREGAHVPFPGNGTYVVSLPPR